MNSPNKRDVNVPPSNQKRKRKHLLNDRKRDREQKHVPSNIMVSNQSAVNDVNEDMLANNDSLQVSVQNSLTSPNKIRNKSSPIELSKHSSLTVSNKKDVSTKKRNKNHCRVLNFDKCDVGLKNKRTQGQKKIDRGENQIG